MLKFSSYTCLPVSDELQDVVRMLKMVHGSSGENLLWPMIRYAQAGGNEEICRAVILTHLNEPLMDVDELFRRYDGEINDPRDVGLHCKTATELLNTRQQEGAELTLAQLVKEWRSKSADAPQWYVVSDKTYIVHGLTKWRLCSQLVPFLSQCPRQSTR
jgi:hypothetical protein